MSENIIVLDAQIVNPGDLSWELSWAPLEKLGRLTVYERTPRSQLIEVMREATIALNSLAIMSREILAECPKLKYVGLLSTGYDNIDLKAATELGIAVTNVPGFCSAMVSQQAMALLLEICHNVGVYSQAVHEGNWVDSRQWSFREYPLIELSGLTMGVIGLGRIGMALARSAVGLGMKILADIDHPSVDTGAPVQYVTQEQLLAQSDVISLCCPSNEANREMINQKSIARMKDGVILINIARGNLINDDHLAQALESGKVLAAGLDVISEEPIKPTNPLLRAKNCYITPHVAGSGAKSRSSLLVEAIKNLRMFLEGNPINLLN
jgi:glycerate dehydrogenase